MCEHTSVTALVMVRVLIVLVRILEVGCVGRYAFKCDESLFHHAVGADGFVRDNRWRRGDGSRESGTIVDFDLLTVFLSVTTATAGILEPSNAIRQVHELLHGDKALLRRGRDSMLVLAQMALLTR